MLKTVVIIYIECQKEVDAFVPTPNLIKARPCPILYINSKPFLDKRTNTSTCARSDFSGKTK